MSANCSPSMSLLHPLEADPKQTSLYREAVLLDREVKLPASGLPLMAALGRAAPIADGAD